MMSADHGRIDYARIYDGYWRRFGRSGARGSQDPATTTGEILRITGPRRILDVGCGMGELVLALLRSGFDAKGVDISSVAIGHARKGAPDRFQVASALALPFPEDAFSTVISVNLIEHLHGRDVGKVLGEMWRVCSDTLYLRISTAPDGDEPRYFAAKPREWWEDLLFLSGFRKHPARLDVIGYQEIEGEGHEIVLVMQKIPKEIGARYPLDTLSARRDLHMDMTREAGRRSDAHIVRYRLAQQFIRPGDVVLDLACGLGDGTAMLAYGSGAARVTGVTDSAYAVDYAEANFGPAAPRLEFRRGNASEMQWLQDGSVDYAVSMETLERLPDPEGFLAEIHRVLKPSGRIIVSVPNEWADETGSDPNPRHVHVYDLPTLSRQIGAHFMVECIWSQTAGGGFKLPDAERTLQEVDPGSGSIPDPEWWLCLAMKSPLAASNMIGYRETVNQSMTCPGSHVVDFAAWYDNPYLYHGLVNRGFRLKEPTLLSRLSHDVIDGSAVDSADRGGALCVLAYRLLYEFNFGPSAAGVQPSGLRDLNRWIDDYVATESKNPHVARWKISLLYVQGLLLRMQGDLAGAKTAFGRCMAMDPLAFSPLIATKTLAAGLAMAEIELARDERAAARRTLDRALRTATAVVGQDWPNVIGNVETSFIFGFLELRDVCDLAAKCALVLEGLNRGWTNAYIQARSLTGDMSRTIAALNETLAERGRRVAVLNEALAERDKQVAALDETIAERGRQVAALNGEVAALHETIAERHRQLVALHGKVEEIWASSSWRLTRPLRGLKLVLTGRVGLSHPPVRYGPTSVVYLTWKFLFHARRFGLASACLRAATAITARIPVVRRLGGRKAARASVVAAPTAAIPLYPPPARDQRCPPVAMLVRDFHDGGLEKVVVDLAKQFLKQGIVCPILVAESAGRAARMAEEIGCSVQEFGGDVAKLVSAVRENGFKVVITHHCYEPLEPLAMADVKLIEVIHNAYYWQRDLPCFSGLRDRCVDRFVAVSDFVRDYALAALSIPADRIRVIENGLSRYGLIRPAFRQLSRQRATTVNRPLLVHLANAHPQKNHVAVLRAFESVLAEYSGASLVLAGIIDDTTDTGRRVQAEIEARNLHGRVRCAGPLGRRELSRLLADAHLGLLPSAFEGFSIASLEYAYFGLPTVLSDTGAARRLTDRYGHAVIADAAALSAERLESAGLEHRALEPDPSTVAGIAAATRTILENYAKFADTARQAGEDWESYSIEAVARRYRDLLVEAAA